MIENSEVSNVEETEEDAVVEIQAEAEIESEEEEAEFEEENALVELEDPEQQKRLIEALIFASPEPVTLRTIQSRLPDSADCGKLLLDLQEEYEERGVNLVRLEDAWAFRTAADIGPYLSLAKKQEKKLSRAALETLSIIAYHQPVTRAEIENIRGVATNKGTLDVLLEAGWIKPGRRRETPGRPVTWITSTTFLDEFGISELKDLPGLQELKASGLLDIRPAIETIPGASDLFEGQDGKLEVEDDENNPSEDYEHIGEFDQITESESNEDNSEEDEQQKESA
ncbi:MAG: SMC-Scp complex subunit ScpB [Alphaproteobacteria bacterium]|nr:SMC-Scp complex subunit ScpB [Alphaproteobacteria bacterium]